MIEPDRAALRRDRGVVEASKGKIRADVAHDRLQDLGFTGSDRTSRRAVAAVKAAYGPGMCGCTGRGSPNRACGCARDFGDARSSRG